MANSELADYIRIDSPKKLWEVVDSLHGLIAARSVIQIDEASGPTATQVFIDNLRPDAVWPDDIFEMTFEELATGLRFRLTCETYHGSGGSFERID